LLLNIKEAKTEGTGKTMNAVGTLTKFLVSTELVICYSTSRMESDLTALHDDPSHTYAAVVSYLPKKEGTGKTMN